MNDAEFLQTIQCRNQMDNDNDDFQHDIVRRLNTNTKHLKIAHLNIRGLRNKVDEIRILLKLCRFNIFGITETHLKSEIADGEIEIENYNFIRRDRPERQGGGCIIYYRKSLKTIAPIRFGIRRGYSGRNMHAGKIWCKESYTDHRMRPTDFFQRFQNCSKKLG